MKYLVTANVNVAARGLGMAEGYKPGHPVATVGYYDVQADDHEAAANIVWVIGNRMAADDNGQNWPSDVRSMSVGDVLYVADEDSKVMIFAVSRFGWTEVEQPTNRCQVELGGQEEHTSRPVPAVNREGVIRNGIDVQYRKVGRGYVRFHQCPEGYHAEGPKETHQYLVYFLTGDNKGKSVKVWLKATDVLKETQR